jgi:hypothetical protein
MNRQSFITLKVVIFLDIDGVMVPAKSWKRPEFLNDGFPEFSSKAVNVLQKLISEDTTVMLTTSHKSRYSIEAWKCIFLKRGIQINKLKRLDEPAFGTSRKDEILNWFHLNNIAEDFVIIDDDKSLYDLPPFLKENLISTSPMIGLTESQFLEIKAKGAGKLQLA